MKFSELNYQYHQSSPNSINLTEADQLPISKNKYTSNAVPSIFVRTTPCNWAHQIPWLLNEGIFVHFQSQWKSLRKVIWLTSLITGHSWDYSLYFASGQQYRSSEYRHFQLERAHTVKTTIGWITLSDQSQQVNINTFPPLSWLAAQSSEGVCCYQHNLSLPSAVNPTDRRSFPNTIDTDKGDCQTILEINFHCNEIIFFRQLSWW